MRVEFSKKFSKDLDGIKVKSVKQSLRRLIELIEAVANTAVVRRLIGKD